MKIYAFHLLNDYSGSPKVLMQLINGWTKKNLNVHLATCSKREGFLSDLSGVSYSYFWYRWHKNRYVRLINLCLSQLLLIFTMMFKINKNDIIYINTVLPFGAAILGKLKGCRIIYHLHETSLTPAVFKKALFGIAKWASTDAIYVSRYLLHREPFKQHHTHILYNAIERDFIEKAQQNIDTKENLSRVLMVCSLKQYKGIDEYVTLSKKNDHLKFWLVINASQEEIEAYFDKSKVPDNLKIFPTQVDLHNFYRWADVIVNLSRPDMWIETFGLTIIEGMAYGLPAIVPPVGGIAELVEEGSNGYQVDSRDLPQLNKKLNLLLSDGRKYQKMMKYARQKVKGFGEEKFIADSMSILGFN